MQPYTATIKFLNLVLQEFTAKGDAFRRPCVTMIKPSAPEAEKAKYIAHVSPDWRYHWSLNVNLNIVDKIEEVLNSEKRLAVKRKEILELTACYQAENSPEKNNCRHKFGDILQTETTIFAKCKFCEYNTTLFASKQNWKKG